MESKNLSIPIYLNQRIVFDLLAIVEDGFSKLQTIKTSETTEKNSNVDANADLGIKNVFAFLNLGMNGGYSKGKAKASQKEIEENRVYTPASLFSRLRRNLIDNELLITLDDKTDFNNIKPGCFVEFSGLLRKNPMVGYMEGAIQMMETALLFYDNKKKLKSEKEVLGQMKKFLSMMTQAGYIDLIADLITKPETKAVLPVQLEFFSNESPADIIDGQFFVLGKVIKNVMEGSNDNVNLLRGTPLSYLPEENLREFTDAFSSFTDLTSINDEFTTKIKSPVLQIVPIAIFA